MTEVGCDELMFASPLLIITQLFHLSCVVPSLQQTRPPPGVGVCLHSSVEFTCTTQDELTWRDLTTSTSQPAFYDDTSVVNQTLMTGVFRTVLTNISGNTLTSTATINSVNLSDLERNISCRDSTGLSSRQIATIKLEGQHRSEQGGGRLGGL